MSSAEKSVPRVALRVGAGASLAALLFTASGSTAFAQPTHKDEITTYATAVAISQVASDRCPEILAYPGGLTMLRGYLHLEPADEMAVQLQIRGMMKIFTDDFKNSLSTEAWCEKALTFFGQDGTRMRGLLKRR